MRLSVFSKSVDGSLQHKGLVGNLTQAYSSGTDSYSSGDFSAELIDQDNLLRTQPSDQEPEKSTLVACLERTGATKGLWLFRLFGVDHPKNTQKSFTFSSGSAYGLKQF